MQDDGDVPPCNFSQYLNLANMDGGWRIINSILDGCTLVMDILEVDEADLGKLSTNLLQ